MKTTLVSLLLLGSAAAFASERVMPLTITTAEAEVMTSYSEYCTLDLGKFSDEPFPQINFKNEAGRLYKFNGNAGKIKEGRHEQGFNTGFLVGSIMDGSGSPAEKRLAESEVLLVSTACPKQDGLCVETAKRYFSPIHFSFTSHETSYRLVNEYLSFDVEASDSEDRSEKCIATRVKRFQGERKVSFYVTSFDESQKLPQIRKDLENIGFKIGKPLKLRCTKNIVYDLVDRKKEVFQPGVGCPQIAE